MSEGGYDSYLRAGSRPEGTWRCAPRRSHYYRMPGTHITPSDEVGTGTRYHGMIFHKNIGMMIVINATAAERLQSVIRECYAGGGRPVIPPW